MSKKQMTCPKSQSKLVVRARQKSFLASVSFSLSVHEFISSDHSEQHFSFSQTAAAAKSLQSCPTLCDPVDGSPPGSPVPGILQASGVGCHFLIQCMKVKSENEVAQSCLTLCDPIDVTPPGSPVPGILQARTLEWVAISFLVCEMSAIVC